MRNGAGERPHGMTETFASGLQMGESPRSRCTCAGHDGRFWMCDWLTGEVLVFDGHGSSEVMARIAQLPFSIDWLPDGRMAGWVLPRRAGSWSVRGRSRMAPRATP